MNLALDQLADNPIIDELVTWPPRPRAITSLRACSVLFRKPFIEFEYADGSTEQRHFPREDFGQHWAEARVYLETLTSIQLVTEFACPEPANREALVAEAMTARDESITEAELMYAEGMYAQYLQQFGEDYRDLPAEVVEHLEHARAVVAARNA